MNEAFITVLVKQSGIVARQASAGNNYEHNNAPRAFLTDAKGDALTLNGGDYSATYTYTIPEQVGTFRCYPEDMEVVVFVHGNISRSAARMVYNADQVYVVEDGAQKAAMRLVSLYRNSYNKGLRSLSEQNRY